MAGLRASSPLSKNTSTGLAPSSSGWGWMRHVDASDDEKVFQQNSELIELVQRRHGHEGAESTRQPRRAIPARIWAYSIAALVRSRLAKGRTRQKPPEPSSTTPARCHQSRVIVLV